MKFKLVISLLAMALFQTTFAASISPLQHVENQIALFYSRGQLNEAAQSASYYLDRGLVEYAFKQDDSSLWNFLAQQFPFKTMGYLQNTVNQIISCLETHAFTKGDPFNSKEIQDTFREHNFYLVNSDNKYDFANRMNNVFASSALNMSHLSLAPLQVNFNHGHTKTNDQNETSEEELGCHESFCSQNILYIKLNSFHKEHIEIAYPKVKSAIAKNLNLVIDLRDNMGGKIYLLEKLLSLFFSNSADIAAFAGKELIKDLYFSAKADYRLETIFYSAFTVDRFDSYLRAKPVKSLQNLAFTGKIALLIGPDTASAAESFSYALKLYNKATVIGQKSSGESLVSDSQIIEDCLKLCFPIGELIFKDGICLEGLGVCPDFEILNPTIEDISRILFSQP